MAVAARIHHVWAMFVRSGTTSSRHYSAHCYLPDKQTHRR